MVLTRLITAAEVAKVLHVHINTVRRWANDGSLKSYRIGPRGDRRFFPMDVDNFILKGRSANE